MSDDEIEQLTQQFESVRIQRQATIEALERVNQAESNLISQIRAAMRRNPARQRNPHRIGDYVRITNHLRNEHGITGVVVSSPARLVTIRNERTRREYTRGWWNLAPAERDPPTPTTSSANIQTSNNTPQ